MAVFKSIFLTAVLAIPLPASADCTTHANIYGEPQYGTTTTCNDGARYETRPDIYGQPEFGTTTTGPNGTSCRTRPNIYGEPQYGTTTSCD